jgi:hypothetical protein
MNRHALRAQGARPIRLRDRVESIGVECDFQEPALCITSRSDSP